VVVMTVTHCRTPYPGQHSRGRRVSFGNSLDTAGRSLKRVGGVRFFFASD
jgi:hypothetical protein